MPRLYKKEKLCSATAIDTLFVPRRNTPEATANVIHSALVFPLRAVWMDNNSRRSDAPIQFLISVPKKRIRHAVGRVAVRRRVREAYRLCRDIHPLPDGRRVDLALIYVDNTIQPYDRIHRAVDRLLAQIAAHDTTTQTPTP